MLYMHYSAQVHSVAICHQLKNFKLKPALEMPIAAKRDYTDVQQLSLTQS